MPEWTEERPLCVVTGFGYLGDKFLREKGFKHVRFLSADGALESYPPGPTISPVYCRRDGKVDVEYYAINIVVPQKQLYKSIQQLRSIGGSGVLVTKLTYIFDEETPRWRPLRARVVTWRMVSFWSLTTFSVLHHTIWP